MPLYSLEKLIEWKLGFRLLPRYRVLETLYSLEKLIEWKLQAKIPQCRQSLLSTRA
ncbi:hypothetical protein [Microcystis aeruginosa]|uniref:hypothetical protein n=1 Tax=Microcystis aeruginosa TaxID=1126 RepID=UPI003A522107